GGVDDLAVAHIDAHVAVVVAGEGDEVAGLRLRLRDDPAAEGVALRRLAGQVHARLVVRVVHQPRAVEAARGRGAAPLVADTQLRARRVDGGLPVEVAAGAGGAGPAAAGDAHAAVQRVPRLRADHGVHADAGRGLQGTHRRA